MSKITKVMVPYLRFPSFDTEWKENLLSELADFRNGKAHEQAISESGGYVVVNSKFISTEGKVRKFSDSQIAPLASGEITMVMSDIPKGRALAKCYFVEEDEVYTLNQRICALSTTRSYGKFLFYRTNRNRYFLEFDSGVGQTNLRKDEILDCPLCCPESLSEQRKIADFLTAVDGRIGQLIQKKALLEDYKKGVMQQLFTQAIRFKDEHGNDFPDWEEKKLGEVSDVRDGTHESPKYHNNGYPLVTSKNLKKDGSIDMSNVDLISEEDFQAINKRSKVETGDIIFGMIGTIGNPVVVSEAGFAIKNVALIKEQIQLSNKFLIQYLDSSNIARQFHVENTGGTQKFIALGVIRKLLIQTPSSPEQTKIADFLSAIDHKIESVSTQITETQTFKRGLLQQMFV
jgi:type I restriction enzyme, S subunit